MTPEETAAFIESRRSADFLAASRSPGMWSGAARRHKRAADILYGITHAAAARQNARFDATPVTEGPGTPQDMTQEEAADYYDLELLWEYFLLAGYSLECVYKGHLLATHPEHVVNDEKISKTVAIHDLDKLCQDCGLQPTPDELEVLKYISQHVIWGRYPGPLQRKDMPTPYLADPLSSKSLTIMNPFHDHRVKKIVDDLFMRGWNLLGGGNYAS